MMGESLPFRKPERRLILDELMQGLRSFYDEFKIHSKELRGAFDMWSWHVANMGGHGLVLKALIETFANLPDGDAKERLKQVVHIAVDKCMATNDFYIAKELCSAVSMAPDLLYEHAKKNGVLADGRANYDLCRSMHEFGTPEEIDSTYRFFPLSEADAFNDTGVSGRMRSSMDELRVKYDAFCKRAGLPVSKMPPYIPDANAAVELSKGSYDLSIGILKSGAPLTNLLSSLDQPVSYIEWHRKWGKRKPVWKEIACTRSSIEKGMSILLIENDAVSGSTLDAVSRVVDTVSPSSVGVCFNGVQIDHSKKVAKKMKRFDKVFHTTELPQDHVCSNILAVNESLEKKIVG